MILSWLIVIKWLPPQFYIQKPYCICVKLFVYYDLTLYVQEEMSDLRALIRLKEKELRCLEWSLMAQKAQEAAGAFVPESLREELEDHKTEQQVGQTPSAPTEAFCFNFLQSQGEMSKREQDVGLLWQTRFKSGCPTWEITHLPKQNPSRPRKIFWFDKVFCWDVLSLLQHRFIPHHTPLSLSNEEELTATLALTLDTRHQKQWLPLHVQTVFSSCSVFFFF